jgi:hypothetical protein
MIKTIKNIELMEVPGINGTLSKPTKFKTTNAISINMIIIIRENVIFVGKFILTPL